MPEALILTPGLSFDDELHTYTLDGEQVPGVTGAIEAAGFVSPFARDDEEAMARGVAVHAATHYDDEGDLAPDSVTEIVAPYLEAWRRFRRETGFTLPPLFDGRIGCEVALASRVYRFATILDRLGFFPRANLTLAVLDIKTGSPGDAAALQTAAQMMLCIENNIPAAERFAVKLNDDGSYRLHHYKRSDYLRDRDDFLACLRVSRRLRNGKENR